MQIEKEIRLIIIFLFLIPMYFHVSGQVTKIMGKVTDVETKEPIPFANIIIQTGGKQYFHLQSVCRESQHTALPRFVVRRLAKTVR